jgi:hypothetical protein
MLPKRRDDHDDPHDHNRSSIMLLTVLIISTVSSRMMIPPVIKTLRPPRRMIAAQPFEYGATAGAVEIPNVNVWPQFQRERRGGKMRSYTVLLLRCRAPLIGVSEIVDKLLSPE